MKQETNNEIDLMLRRLSRRHEVPVSDADSDHLDADELSAYAENALPAAARARYTEHLADCSKCRELVVQLSASVPVVAAKETAAVAAPSVLRKFLASFFSPMVLRYAVPALGLIVVAAIGFSVLRSRQAPEMAQSSAPAETPNVSAKAYQSPASGLYDDGLTRSSSPSASRQPEAEKPMAAAQEPAPPNAPQSGDIAAAKTAPVQRAAEETAANAPPPRAEPVATPTPAVDEMRVDVQGRRNEQSGPSQAKDLAKQKTGEGSQGQEKKVSEFESSARERAPAPASVAGRTQAGRTFGLADKAEKDSDDGVIRSVAGRRFRKQSGIWVDTAYSSGGAITNVSRGSEQYRSLVADEPEIKKFADELDGPFVVVWKGRAYRIR